MHFIFSSISPTGRSEKEVSCPLSQGGGMRAAAAAIPSFAGHLELFLGRKEPFPLDS